MRSITLVRLQEKTVIDACWKQYWQACRIPGTMLSIGMTNSSIYKNNLILYWPLQQLLHSKLLRFFSRSSVSSYKTHGKFSNCSSSTIQYSAQAILPLDELRRFYCQSNDEGQGEGLINTVDGLRDMSIKYQGKSDHLHFSLMNFLCS